MSGARKECRHPSYDLVMVVWGLSFFRQFPEFCILDHYLHIWNWYLDKVLDQVRVYRLVGTVLLGRQVPVSMKGTV
jgi:uncharacterized protein Usg